MATKSSTLRAKSMAPVTFDYELHTNITITRKNAIEILVAGLGSGAYHRLKPKHLAKIRNAPYIQALSEDARAGLEAVADMQGTAPFASLAQPQLEHLCRIVLNTFMKQSMTASEVSELMEAFMLPSHSYVELPPMPTALYFYMINSLLAVPELVECLRVVGERERLEAEKDERKQSDYDFRRALDVIKKRGLIAVPATGVKAPAPKKKARASGKSAAAKSATTTVNIAGTNGQVEVAKVPSRKTPRVQTAASAAR